MKFDELRPGDLWLSSSETDGACWMVVTVERIKWNDLWQVRVLWLTLWATGNANKGPLFYEEQLENESINVKHTVIVRCGS